MTFNFNIVSRIPSHFAVRSLSQTVFKPLFPISFLIFRGNSGRLQWNVSPILNLKSDVILFWQMVSFVEFILNSNLFEKVIVMISIVEILVPIPRSNLADVKFNLLSEGWEWAALCQTLWTFWRENPFIKKFVLAHNAGLWTSFQI